ncbi:MAG TPA: hypothetical protein ENI05_13015, partial [Porticoccus sp.]|nr:hypothetical protein [Porticoccus sp.]
MARKLLFAIEVDDKGTPKIKEFSKATEKADKKTTKLSSAVKTAASRTAKFAGKAVLLAGKLGLLAGAGAIGGVVAGLLLLKRGLTSAVRLISKFVDAASEQEAVEKRLEAVIKATGNAAGFSIDQLKIMASEFQNLSTVGDEVVLSAQAILATFKNISGDVFKRTTQAALDMA